jgi:hypothetical protein
MAAWINTLIDLAVLGAVYLGVGWLLDGDSTLAGYAVGVAGYNLLLIYKGRAR